MALRPVLLLLPAQTKADIGDELRQREQDRSHPKDERHRARWSFRQGDSWQGLTTSIMDCSPLPYYMHSRRPLAPFARIAHNAPGHFPTLNRPISQPLAHRRRGGSRRTSSTHKAPPRIQHPDNRRRHQPHQHKRPLAWRPGSIPPVFGVGSASAAPAP